MASGGRKYPYGTCLCCVCKKMINCISHHNSCGTPILYNLYTKDNYCSNKCYDMDKENIISSIKKFNLNYKLRSKKFPKLKNTLKNEKRFIEKTIKLLKKSKPNTKDKKIKKHFPFIWKKDEDFEYKLYKERIILEYKINKKYKQRVYLFDIGSNKNKYERSYSVLDMSIKDHIKNIINQLKIYINRINIDIKYNKDAMKIYNKKNKTFTEKMCNRLTQTEIGNNVISLCTKEYNKKNGTHYSKIYVINMVPLGSFIETPSERKIKIATTYILAFNGNIFNILFGYYETKTRPMGYAGDINKIYDFNKRKTVTVSCLFNVINNTFTLTPNIDVHIGDNIFKNDVSELDESRKIEKFL